MAVRSGRRVSRTTRLVRWALHARGGLALVVGIASGCGIVAVLLVLWAGGAHYRLGDRWPLALLLAGIYPAAALLAGLALALRDRRSYLGWLDKGRPPTPEEARRLLHLPVAVAVRALLFWLPGCAILLLLVLRLTDYRNVAVLVGGLGLGAIETAGMTFLVVDRLLRPTVPVVARALGSTVHWSASVLTRILVTSLVSVFVPLGIVIVLLSDPRNAPEDRARAALLFAVVGLAIGVLATMILARAVAAPIRTLRVAVDRITLGDSGVRVPIRSAGDIGALEHSVDQLAASLRERERTQEVFGRHVGPKVAERALAGPAELTGEICEVTALFVDVTDSVGLSAAQDPQEFVATLNRLLATVVTATEAEGGLVNKFAGDAALCIFGAPLPLGDDATPALRAARRIRDDVAAAGEVDIGIGVARGRVFAGDVGTDTRREFTVIGDAVNQAARLTGAAKRAPRRILAGRAVIDATAEPERDRWQFYADLRLRGLTDRTSCWTDVAAVPEQSPGSPVDAAECVQPTEHQQ